VRLDSQATRDRPGRRRSARGRRLPNGRQRRPWHGGKRSVRFHALAPGDELWAGQVFAWCAMTSGTRAGNARRPMMLHARYAGEYAPLRRDARAQLDKPVVLRVPNSSPTWQVLSSSGKALQSPVRRRPRGNPCALGHRGPSAPQSACPASSWKKVTWPTWPRPERASLQQRLQSRSTARAGSRTARRALGKKPTPTANGASLRSPPWARRPLLCPSLHVPGGNHRWP